MIIGYALMLNNECHNFIREIQLELHQVIGIGLPRQTPHITIKSPFEISDIKNHVEYLEDLSLRVKPIDIEFEGFGTFGNKVIFLNVKQSQELYDLHWKVLHEVKGKFDVKPHEFEGENIKFHASIAGFTNEDTFQKAHKLLSEYQPKYNFRATELGIFYYLGEGNGWIVNRRIKLKTDENNM